MTMNTTELMEKTYKENMKNENYQNEISIKCGKVTDGFEKLQENCKEEAERLLTTINVPGNTIVTVAFWTSGFPELIGVGKFTKDTNGKVVYNLDFSESTL